MATTLFGTSRPAKLEVGWPIPAGTSTAGTPSSQAHVVAVGGAQLTCSIAQKKVRAAEESLSAAQARFNERGVEPDEQTLAQLDQLRDAVREARQARDALMQKWAAAVAAFKRRARAAAGDRASTA